MVCSHPHTAELGRLGAQTTELAALHGTAAHVETQVRLYRRWKRQEALQRVAAGYLARPEPASTGGDRCIVHLHTDIGTLRADGDGAEAEIENAPGRGSHVPAGTSKGCVPRTTPTAAKSARILPCRAGTASRWTTTWHCWR